MEIAPDIEKAIKTKQFILFVGAGYSCSPPLNLPSWKNLILFFINEIKNGNPSEFLDALRLALLTGVVTEIQALDVLDKNGYRQKCIDLLSQRIDIDYTEIDLSKFTKLWQITDKIITTNYDCAIENSTPGVIPFTYSDKQAVARVSTSDHYLFKVHGTIKKPNECVLFRDTYEGLYKGNKLAIKELSDIFSHKTILFVGFGLTDPYITEILSELQKLYEGNKDKHFVLTTKNEDFSDYDVETIKLDGWHELDTYLGKLVTFREKVNYGFEEIIRDLDSKKKEYNLEEIEKKYEFFLDDIYKQSTSEELTNYVETGQLDKAEELLSKTFEDKMKRLAFEKKEAAQNAFNLATLKDLQLEYKDVLKYTRQAYELEPDNIAYLKAYCKSLMHSGDYRSAKDLVFKAINLPDIDEEEKMYFKSVLANYYFETGDYQNSLKISTELFNLSLNFYGANSVITIGVNNSIGSSLRNLGRYRDAVSIYENAINQLTKLPTYPLDKLSDFYSNISVAWSNIAWDDNFNPNYYKKALWYAEQALDIKIKNSKDPNKSMSISEAYNQAAIAAKRLNDYEKGIYYYNQALDIIRNIYSENHPRHVAYSMNFAALLRASGKEKEAIKILLSSLEKAYKIYESDHKQIGHIYINLGFSYASIGKFKVAVEQYEKGLPILRKYLKDSHPTMQIFINNYNEFKELSRSSDS